MTMLPVNDNSCADKTQLCKWTLSRWRSSSLFFIQRTDLQSQIQSIVQGNESKNPIFFLRITVLRGDLFGLTNKIIVLRVCQCSHSQHENMCRGREREWPKRIVGVSHDCPAFDVRCPPNDTLWLVSAHTQSAAEDHIFIGSFWVLALLQRLVALPSPLTNSLPPPPQPQKHPAIVPHLPRWGRHNG